MPAPQNMHAAEELFGLNLPASQLVQVDALPKLYVPAAQLAQDDAP